MFFYFFFFLLGSFWKLSKTPFSTNYIIPQKKSVVNSFFKIFYEFAKKLFLFVIFGKSAQTVRMKNKYTDNRLAEELDLIILTDDCLKKQGFPRGTLGTLVYSYTGRGRPLYALFDTGKKRLEFPLSLRDFRVLNERDDKDARIILEYLIRKKTPYPMQA